MANILKFLSENVEAIIAGSALAFTAYEAHATRQHNRLSVRPALSSSTDREHIGAGRTRISATLTNAGIGPAEITSFRLLTGNTAHDVKSPDEMAHVIRRFLPFDLEDWRFFVMLKGYVMPAGEVKQVASIQISIANSPEDYVKEKLRELGLLITYKCAYGKSFTYDTRKHFHTGTAENW